MTMDEAIEWSMKYMSRNARKNHVDYDEHMRRTKYMVNKLYDDFEQQLSNLKHNYEMQEIMIADYKKHIEEYEHMIDWMELS